MEKIDERKLQVLRNAISSLFGYSMELCDIRPELYSINREEWERDIENVRKQIGAKQVLLFIGPFSSGKSSFVNSYSPTVSVTTLADAAPPVLYPIKYVKS